MAQPAQRQFEHRVGVRRRQCGRPPRSCRVPPAAAESPGAGPGSVAEFRVIGLPERSGCAPGFARAAPVHPSARAAVLLAADHARAERLPSEALIVKNFTPKRSSPSQSGSGDGHARVPRRLDEVDIRARGRDRWHALDRVAAEDRLDRRRAGHDGVERPRLARGAARKPLQAARSRPSARPNFSATNASRPACTSAGPSLSRSGRGIRSGRSPSAHRRACTRSCLRRCA